MKILYLLSQKPGNTGSGFYVQSVMKQALQKGHHCYLLSGIQNDSAPNKSDNDLVTLPDSNHSFIRFDTPELPFPIPGMSDVMPYISTRFKDMSVEQIKNYEAGLAKEIKKAVKTFQPDLIHSNHLWLMSAIARSLFPEIPMVTSCHGTDLRQLKNCTALKTNIPTDTIINSCKTIDRIIALSETQKKEISDLYGISENRITVAGNGFDSRLFHPGQKPAIPPVKLLYAGKLSSAKGVPWLLQSLSIMSNRLSGNDLPDGNPPFHLYLAGSGTGDEYEHCKSLANAMKDRVTLLGAINQEVLAGLMRQCHLFVLPSFFEGLPLVLLEALASGCKVITTSLPGSKEVAGNAGDEFIRFIDLPKLETVDTPYSTDMPMLCDRLATILQEEVKTICLNPNLSMAIIGSKNETKIEKIIRKYTWQEVYGRIEFSYAL